MKRSAGAVLFSGVLFSVSAAAQTPPSLNTFNLRPPLDANAGIVVEKLQPTSLGALDFSVWGAYGWRTVTWPNVRPAIPIVNARFATVVTASVGLAKPLSVGVRLPMVLAQSGHRGLGDSVVAKGQVPTSAVGDLDLQLQYTPLTNEGGGFGFGIIGDLNLPTGNRRSFLGAGQVTASARVVGDYSFRVASFQASLGFHGRPTVRRWPSGGLGGLRYGSEAPWSFGLTLHPSILGRWIDPSDRNTLEGAIHGAVPLMPVAPFSKGSIPLVPLSILVADHMRLGLGFSVSAGVDFSLIAVPTAQLPAFSAFLAVRWQSDRKN